MTKSRVSAGRNPISRKALASLKKYIQRKVINISEFKEAKVRADDLEATIISREELSKLDPLHGIYAYAQNKMSVFVEQLSELPALSRLTKAYTDADDIYMPSGPPMSPLTTSYFACWGIFDLCAGIKRESFGTVAIDLCKYLNVDQGLIRVFETMQNSRMGLYVHAGVSGRFVLLREFITNKQVVTIVPSGYQGNPCEIWFARIMPEPFDDLGFDYSVVLTTPYIIGELVENDEYQLTSNEKDWLAFFERNLHRTQIKDKILAYEIFMKYGLHRSYWNEYLLDAYVNYQNDMILLAGFPDRHLRP